MSTKRLIIVTWTRNNAQHCSDMLTCLNNVELTSMNKVELTYQHEQRCQQCCSAIKILYFISIFPQIVQFFFSNPSLFVIHTYSYTPDTNFDTYSPMHCIPFWLCIESFPNDVYNGKPMQYMWGMFTITDTALSQRFDQK